jgi:hypothetical protein
LKKTSTSAGKVTATLFATEYGEGCPSGFHRTYAMPTYPQPSLGRRTPLELCQNLNIYRCADQSRRSFNVRLFMTIFNQI